MPFEVRLLVLTLLATVAGHGAAGEGDHHLSFSWPKPSPAAACEVEDSGLATNRPTLRFAGVVDKDGLGFACSVHIPRRRFDALYRFCKVENVDAVPRERYACLVVYGPSNVTFVYSYTDDFYGAPACEFACSPR